MKKEIHPKYNDKAAIKCACGAVFETGSTQAEMEIEICSQCHPFYTGKKKIVDTTGRVDRFKKIAEKVAKKKEEEDQRKKDKKKKPAAKKEKKKSPAKEKAA